MSTIGRVFIVLNLVLSAAFLGWAANALSKAREYRNELTTAENTHKEAIAAKDAELSKLQIDLTGVTEQGRQMREQKSTFETEANRLKTQLEEFKRANDTMQGNLTAIQATLGEYNNSIAQLTQQKDAAIERAHEAERARDAAIAEKDAAVLAQRDAEEASKAAQLRISDLEGEKVALTEQVETLNTRQEVMLRETGRQAGEFFDVPQIEALVLDVKKDLKLVILNKGKKDEVKVGYTFDIYRGSQYKGQVRVQDVQEGISSAIILSEKNPIGRGDSATTAL